jgi:hypothetical protein
MIMRRGTPRTLTILCCCLPLFFSCARLTGEFALKFPRQDSYRRVVQPVEIQKNETVQWIYRSAPFLQGSPDRLITMKKELSGLMTSPERRVGVDHNVIYA